MTTSTILPAAPPRPSRRLADVPAWAVATGLGVVGVVTSALGSGTASLWGDEAASVLSAQRSLPSLFRMLGHVDAVHGTYYLFLHFWIRLFGPSEVSVRFPSAIAAGIVVAGVYVVATQLANRQTALVAAILCAVLPRMVMVGSEARSYALSTAVAVWLTVWMVSLVQRGDARRRVWIAYALGLAFGLYLFLYLGLLIPVHAVYLVARGRRTPRMLRRWVRGVLIAVVLAAPIFYYGYQERAQIAFLGHRNYARFTLITGLQWFGGPQPWLAVAAWAIILFAAVVVVVRWRRTRQGSDFALLAFAWLLVPTLLLLALNIVTPSYNLRYLAMSTPAAALVMAIGITALRRRWLVAGVTLAALVLAAPIDAATKTPNAKDNSDWQQVSAYVDHIKQPGDALVFDDTVRPSRKPRLALRMYPHDYAGLADVQLVTPYNKTDGLWDVTAPLDDVAPRLATADRVLLFELKGSHDHGTRESLTELESLGFTTQRTHTVHRTIVYTLTRGN